MTDRAQVFLTMAALGLLVGVVFAWRRTAWLIHIALAILLRVVTFYAQAIADALTQGNFFLTLPEPCLPDHAVCPVLQSACAHLVLDRPAPVRCLLLLRVAPDLHGTVLALASRRLAG